VEQQIRFCTAADGVRIAYATVGEGPPLVKAPNWLTHLEFEWRSSVWRHWWEELAKDHLLVRFDLRGCGLSDWAVEDLSFAARVNDLEAVVAALGLDRFVLLGISAGGPVAVEYAVRHPEKVSHLILHGTSARGWAKRGQAVREAREALLTLTRLGWGQDNPAFQQIFTSRFIPGATAEQMNWFNELQRISTSPENAARIDVESGKVDVLDRLARVAVPSLVLHSRGDAVTPIDEGRQLAALILNARFVPLEGRNHILLESESAWPTFLSEVRRFLGVTVPGRSHSPPPASNQASITQRRVAAQGHDDPVDQGARALIATLDAVELSRFSVVSGYSKYDEGVRNALKDARQNIAEAFVRSSRKRENHLLWASPGSGKTYFVQQVGASLSREVQYHELNLAKCSQQEFLSSLKELETGSGPRLCLVDEIDAKWGEAWPYETLLPYLDAAVDRDARFVFVLAGSSGSSLPEMKRGIVSRPKGTDLLSRIPVTNEYVIPPFSIGDRILVALSQLRQAGQEAGKVVQEVEKLGLFFVALSPRLANARQLREFAVRAVERMPPGEDRVKYDHLFSAGDQDNKAFWVQAAPMAADLVNRFVALKD
jgi:pimeloyl-ACP methyl ester carboxylesterase